MAALRSSTVTCNKCNQTDGFRDPNRAPVKTLLPIASSGRSASIRSQVIAPACHGHSTYKDDILKISLKPACQSLMANQLKVCQIPRSRAHAFSKVADPLF
jgi:hypothetical protein